MGLAQQIQAPVRLSNIMGDHDKVFHGDEKRRFKDEEKSLQIRSSRDTLNFHSIKTNMQDAGMEQADEGDSRERHKYKFMHFFVVRIELRGVAR